MPSSSLTKVSLTVDRQTLTKRRWHGVAADGMDFGFDLETPLHDGAVFFENEVAQYVLSQKPELILEVVLGTPAYAAQTAWSLGNLHFPIEVTHNTIRVADDPAVRLYLERNHIPFETVTEVFRPIRAVSPGHSHGHTH